MLNIFVNNGGNIYYFFTCVTCILYKTNHSMLNIFVNNGGNIYYFFTCVHTLFL